MQKTASLLQKGDAVLPYLHERCWRVKLIPVHFSLQPATGYKFRIDRRSDINKNSRIKKPLNLRSSRLLPTGITISFRGKYDGVRGGIRTHDPRIHTTSTFAAGQNYDRLWSGLSLHHWQKPLGAARPVSTPSLCEGLVRDWQWL